MSPFLLFSAILPVLALCYIVYSRDRNREPFLLLLKIFFLGFLSAIPVVVIELLLGIFFPTEGVGNFIILFINIFISVALVEEAFKYLIVKFFGYNNKAFDEAYDIIVYSVFSSLGFACIENILYVINTGLISTAISRAIFSIPGHMCFGVLMGYYLSKAKISSDKNIRNNNLVLGLLIPCLFHTIYDALLFYGSIMSVFIFYIFDIFMLIICISIIIKMSKIQENVSVNIQNGTILNENGVVRLNNSSAAINFCPVCGKPANGGRYCGGCGMKLSE